MASNLPSITVGKFLEIIEKQVEEGNKRPLFGLGKGGIGKTESIQALAKKLGIGYIDIRLLLYAETDLKGIPYPNSDNTKTIWLQNSILPIKDRDGEKGILVFDEITSSSRSVRTAAYQLLNERRLGEYILPEDWIIICLGNGEEDGGDFQGMEGNFANRCSVFNITTSAESWKKWANENGINYLVTSFISWQPQFIHTFNPDREDEMLFASPRSWKAVSDILNKNEYDKDDILTQYRIMANIGTIIGQQFISFCNFKESSIDPADILDGKRVYNMGSIEIMFMTIQGTINTIIEEIRLDVKEQRMITLETIKRFANVIKWMLSLDRMEHKVMALNELINTEKGLISKIITSAEFDRICPELRKFTAENANAFSSR